jgi:hypothetical protein
MERLCLDCQSPIKGRADKKFCDDICRNNFNNLLKAEELVYLKQINQILKKNRKILKEECQERKIKIKRAQLVRRGFNFDYHTHIYLTKSGASYYFCYEYGYLSLGEMEVLIVKREGNE